MGYHIVLAKSLLKSPVTEDLLMGRYCGKLGNGTITSTGALSPPEWMDPMYTIQVGNYNVFMVRGCLTESLETVSLNH